MESLATMYALKAQNVTMPQGAESVCRDVRSLGGVSGFGAQAWLAHAHGSRDGLVLCDVDQAATPQQACADFFLHTTRQHVYVISPDLYAGTPMQHRCRTC